MVGASPDERRLYPPDLMSIFYSQVAKIGEYIVKLIFSLLASYPLAGLLKRVPDARPEYKNLFNIGYEHFPDRALPRNRAVKKSVAY